MGLQEIMRKLFKKEVDTEGKAKEVVDSFKNEIQKHEDQLFGITLVFQNICLRYSGQEEIIEMNRKHFRNIMQRGQDAITKARQLLYDTKNDPSKVKLIRHFQFPPIHGHPLLDEMTKTAKVLVEIYNELYPGRPRETPLTETELSRLMDEARVRLNGERRGGTP